ncbi:hypothetical protein NIIDMKKI_42420 [Mycobacterium kansasii]|uniref:Uncharacterized protein n=1 Tax=Mycobacterium kansasii TaxID=1768 RepID=A0A7G1ID60_MYCKA|nr:hypothetical protein NIIDMKKI_42420 [Mycobacterium kansasii]
MAHNPATHHIADTRNHNQPRTATDPTAAGIAVLNSPSATPTPYSSQVGCERQFRSRCAANAVVARSGHGECLQQRAADVAKQQYGRGVPTSATHYGNPGPWPAK